MTPTYSMTGHWARCRAAEAATHDEATGLMMIVIDEYIDATDDDDCDVVMTRERGGQRYYDCKKSTFIFDAICGPADAPISVDAIMYPRRITT